MGIFKIDCLWTIIVYIAVRNVSPCLNYSNSAECASVCCDAGSFYVVPTKGNKRIFSIGVEPSVCDGASTFEYVHG